MPEPGQTALLGMVAASVAAPCLIVDPDTDRIVAANEQASRLFGVEDATGLSFAKLHPDAVERLVVFVEEVVYRGVAWTRRIEGKRADGETLSLEYEARALDAAQGMRLVFLASDLRERARRDGVEEAYAVVHGGLLEWRRLERLFTEAERLNDLILTSAGDGIYGVDPDGMTTFANPAAEAMLGWSAADLIGRNMHELIHHHHADGTPYPAEDCPIYNAFRHAKVNLVEDEIFWRKDGRPIRVEYSSTPITDGNEVLGAVIIFRDITERKENERRLRDALAEVERLKERLEQENAYLQEEVRDSRKHHEIIGVSPAIAKTLKQIELVAPTDANVLIIGESGTGKELVAQAIHADSARADRPLIRVNCAAIPRELFESEFFGHVKGAFTGAVRDRVGRFELANGGTIFLDEVGEIPLELQGKLLRVLQERTFERLGEAETHETDVRIIAATNRDLASAVADGDFREDLYFRLNVFPIHLTALRDRPEDIPPLAVHFSKLSARMLNLPEPLLSRSNVETLTGYSWPGNARELANVIERALILSQGRKLSFELPAAPSASRSPELLMPASAGTTVIETDEARRARDVSNIRAALLASGGKVSGPGGAAEKLGVKPTTLYSRIQRLSLK
ncbi:MAG: sigma 54-interacting transcriptional regulator [Pseudomonadota bacterium]